MKFSIFHFIVDIIEGFYNVSLRVKIIGLVIFAVLILGLPVAYFVNENFSQQNNMQLRLISRIIGEQLSSQSVNYILESDSYALTKLLKNSLKSVPDVVYIFIENKNGAVVASTFNGGFPLGLIKSNNFNIEKLHTVKIRTSKGIVYDTSAPILKGRLGRVRVGISATRSVSVIHALIKSILFAMLFAAILAVILSGVIVWWIMSPIIELSDAINAVKNGNYDVELNNRRDDEIGMLAMGFNEMTSSLKKANDEHIENDNLRKNFIVNIIKAQEDERGRIARELHDQFAQTLAYIKIRFGLLKNLKSFEEVKISVAQINEDLTNALDIVHGITKNLMPGILSDMGLVCAIQSHIDDINKKSPNFSIEFIMAGTLKNKRFNAGKEINAYRIIQEALSNIILHSRSNYAKIKLEESEGGIVCVVEDYGVGFRYDIVRSDSFGIFGMIERAELLGGKLKINSTPGKGTSVEFWIPV